MLAYHLHLSSIIELLQLLGMFRATVSNVLQRPLFLIEQVKSLRKRVMIILRTIRRMIEFFFVLLFSIFLSSLMFYSLFGKINDPNFATLFDSFISTFILHTTSNYPDISIAPAKVNPIYSFVFVVFLMMQLYFITNVSIATVFSHYKFLLQKKRIKQFIRGRLALIYSYLLLFKQYNNIDLEIWKGIFAHFRPYIRDEAETLYLEAVSDSNATLDIEQYIRLCDKIPSMPHINKKTKATSVCNFSISHLQKIVEHWIFKAIILAFIFASCIVVTLQLQLDSMDSLLFRVIEALFLFAFFGELCLRVGAYGIYGFFTDKWNLYVL